MKFYIKKVVEAKGFTDALKKEAQGEVTDIWKEESKISDLTSAIGFQVEHYQDYDEENRYNRKTKN